MELIIFLIIGALAGFAAGLFGVGGGTIIVPLLFIVFSQMDFPADSIMHLALGTSLATIIVTSISSLMVASSLPMPMPPPRFAVPHGRDLSPAVINNALAMNPIVRVVNKEWIPPSTPWVRLLNHSIIRPS